MLYTMYTRVSRLSSILMYIYLYDTFLKDKKYAGLVSAYENRLTDFGIFGKIVRITRFTNPQRIIEDEVRRGAKTVVIVGNDDTFARVISRSADINGLTFGLLPVGEENSVAEMLGIPVAIDACDILSRRRVESLDVGTFNDRFFFKRISLAANQFELVCEDKYAVGPQDRESQVEICNLGVPSWEGDATPKLLKPQDGKLTIFMRPTKKSLFGTKFIKPSVLQVGKIRAHFKHPVVVSVDGIQSREKDIEVNVSRKKFKIIVGKARKF